MRSKGETRWEASKRPLFVKTVWLDGRRHAILSRDDPLVITPSRRASSATTARVATPSSGKRPRRSSVDTRRMRSSTAADLEECLRRLRLALCPEDDEGQCHSTRVPPLSAPPQRPQRNNEAVVSRHFSAIVRRAPSPPPPQAAQLLIPAESFLPETNPLSERVLQWLDLEVRRQKKRKEEGEPEECSLPEKCRRTAKERRSSWMSKKTVSRSEDLPTVVSVPIAMPYSRVPASNTGRFPPTDSGVESGESSRGDTPPPVEETVYSAEEEWSVDEGRSTVRRELHIFVPVQVEKDQMSDCCSGVFVD